MMVQTVSEPIPFGLYGDSTTLQPSIHQDSSRSAFPLDVVTISPAAQASHALESLLNQQDSFSQQQNAPDAQVQAPAPSQPQATVQSLSDSSQVNSDLTPAALWVSALGLLNN